MLTDMGFTVGQAKIALRETVSLRFSAEISGANE